MENDDRGFSKDSKLETDLDKEKKGMVRNLIAKTKLWREYKELKFKKDDESTKNVLRELKNRRKQLIRDEKNQERKMKK